MIRRTAPALALLALVAACGGESVTKDAAPSAPAAPTHAPVVARAIADLEGRVEEPPAPEPADAALVEEVLQVHAGGDRRMHEMTLEEIASVGDAAVAQLADAAVDSEGPTARRAAAIELLRGVGTERAGLALVALCDSRRETWVRRHAAWRLSELDPEVDLVVPGLLLRLRSETDHEAAIYVAGALATRRNFAGLEMLDRLARGDADEAARTRAAGQLAQILEREGFESARELIELWNRSADELPTRAPSDRLRLEAWRWIRTLSGETFQLRPVDDGRFLLMRLGPWIVEPLARALGDEDAYVRLHVAQCLERMGERARGAVPALLEALADPRTGPQAARALGAVGGPDARPALLDALETGDHELRVAAARALGALGESDAVPPLEALRADEAAPIDLRQAAAESLLLLAPDDLDAPRFLRERLVDPAADVGGAERALGAWLDARGEDAVPEEVRDAWRAADVSAGAIPTPSESDARRSARAEALAPLLTGG